MLGLVSPMDFLMTAGVICLQPNVVDLAAVVKDEESLKQWLCDYAAKHHFSECVFVLGSGLKQVRDALSRDEVEWRSRIEAVMERGNAILAKVEEAGVDVTSMIEITGLSREMLQNSDPVYLLKEGVLKSLQGIESSPIDS